MQGDWIDVEERLPEMNWSNHCSEYVLAWCISHGKTSEFGHPNTYPEGEGYPCIDRLSKCYDRTQPSFTCDRHYGKVTHWMPLPDKPKQVIE